MSQPKVVRPTAQPVGRYIRPADVDAQTWASLKNVTRWMLMQK